MIMLFFQMGSYKEAVCLVCFLGLVTMSYGARIVSHYKGRKLSLLCWVPETNYSHRRRRVQKIVRDQTEQSDLRLCVCFTHQNIY